MKDWATAISMPSSTVTGSRKPRRRWPTPTEGVPVLTIAMDTGFQSIGPFNRAFKAATDVTPTEFRRLATAGNASGSPQPAGVSGIGQPA